jgi:hypothetical protein
MTSRAEITGAVAAAHRLSPTTSAVFVGSWAALVLATRVTLPLQYPYEALDQMISTGVVVGLVLPIAATAIVLDEGPPEIVTAAARSLVVPRASAVVLYAALVGAAASSLASVVPVDFALLVGDAAFLAAKALIGVCLLGLGLGWIVPLATALIASATSLIPWQVDLLYRHGHADELAPITAGLLSLGLAGYVRLGSMGLLGRRATRTSAGQLAE